MSRQIDAELRRLLYLPWTIVPETTPEGDRVLRVLEVPSAVGHGLSDKELEMDLWASLEESLRAFLHFGDPVPVPKGIVGSGFASEPEYASSGPRFYIYAAGESRTASATSLMAGAS